MFSSAKLLFLPCFLDLAIVLCRLQIICEVNNINSLYYRKQMLSASYLSI